MPLCPRLAAGNLACHVLNHRVGRLPLFETRADYVVFEQILAEIHAQTRIRIAAYSLMPTHWHLLLWPRQDGELSEVLRWITLPIRNGGMSTMIRLGPVRCIKVASNLFLFRRMSIS